MRYRLNVRVKDIMEIAEYSGQEDMASEVTRCRRWESSLSSLQRVIRQSRGCDAVSAIVFDTSEEKLLKVRVTLIIIYFCD